MGRIMVRCEKFRQRKVTLNLPKFIKKIIIPIFRFLKQFPLSIEYILGYVCISITIKPPLTDTSSYRTPPDNGHFCRNVLWSNK
jgi:hypothetical protein